MANLKQPKRGVSGVVELLVQSVTSRGDRSADVYIPCLVFDGHGPLMCCQRRTGSEEIVSRH
jgi:hypothetical protein